MVNPLLVLPQENTMTILNQKLHRRILRLRIRHLPLQRLRPHNRRREHDRDIQRRHKIDLLHLRHLLKMKHQKLQRVAMSRWQLVDGAAHHDDAVVGRDLGRGRGVAGRGGSAGEEQVVDGVGDEGCGEFAEVLFQGGGHGVDVEFRIRDVEGGGVGFEAFFDVLDLAIAAGFAVDAFVGHAWMGERG